MAQPVGGAGGVGGDLDDLHERLDLGRPAGISRGGEIMSTPRLMPLAVQSTS